MKHLLKLAFLALIACQSQPETAQPATPITQGDRLTVVIEKTENGYDIYSPDGGLLLEYFLPNDSCHVSALGDVFEIAADYQKNPESYQ